MVATVLLVLIVEWWPSDGHTDVYFSVTSTFCDPCDLIINNEVIGSVASPEVGTYHFGWQLENAGFLHKRLAAGHYEILIVRGADTLFGTTWEPIFPELGGSMGGDIAPQSPRHHETALDIAGGEGSFHVVHFASYANEELVTALKSADTSEYILNFLNVGGEYIQLDDKVASAIDPSCIYEISVFDRIQGPDGYELLPQGSRAVIIDLEYNCRERYKGQSDSAES